MATKIAVANGNFSAAATWATVDSTNLISTSSGTTTLTTSNQNSAAFTPGAITVDGVALKFAYIATTPAMPSSTITVTLRNSTDSIDIVSLAYNLAEIPALGTGYGGWCFFKFDTTYALTAGKSYIIQLKVAATSGQPAVVMATNGTAANWQHILRIPGTTAAPAAGDDFYIMGELASPNTWTSRTVTMDINDSSTDYGNGGSEASSTPGICIGKNGTLNWTTAESTTTYFKLSGSIVIQAGGTFNMGTVGSPIPRTSTATLLLDTTTARGYGIYTFGNLQYDGTAVKSTFTAQGQSRTTGKNVVHAKLSADHSVGATTLNVDTDTGWLNGDLIGINGSEAINQCETKALTGNMGASSGSITALTNAHKGTQPRVCRAVLITRNVNILATGANNIGGQINHYGGDADLDWVQLKNIGGITYQNASTSSLIGSTSYDYVCFYSVDLGNHNGWNLGTGTVDNFHIRNCTTYTAVGVGIYLIQQNVGTNWTINNYVYMTNSSGTQAVTMYRCSTANAIDNLFLHGAGTGFTINEASSGLCTWTHPEIKNIECWWQDSGINLNLSSNYRGYHVNDPWVWTNIKAILCASHGWYSNGDVWRVRIKNGYFCNNDTDNIFTTTNCNMLDLEFYNSTFGNFSGPARTAGYLYQAQGAAGQAVTRLRFYGCDIGAGSVNAHDTSLFHNQANPGAWKLDVIMRGNNIEATTRFGKVAGATHHHDSWLRVSGMGDDTHWSLNPVRGTVAYEATVYRTDAPSTKMTPTSATYKLDSGDRHIAVVDNAAAKTVSVWIRKDSSYNGNAPRLLLRCNPAVGVTDDTVLATSVLTNADTWYQVTAALPVADDDGVMEVYVDCDGTAGNIYVDDWSVS